MISKSFATYRSHKGFEKLYDHVYKNDGSLSGLEEGLFSCIEYLLSTSYTPNLLIDRLIETLHHSLSRLNGKQEIQQALQSLSNYIYTYTYTSPSSSLEYFLMELHGVCDSLEKKL